jgi:hypothetical protein
MKSPKLTELYDAVIGAITGTKSVISNDVADYIQSYCKFATWISQFKFAECDKDLLEDLAKEYQYLIEDGAKYAYVETKLKYNWKSDTYSYGSVRTFHQMKSFVKGSKREGETIHVFDIEEGQEIEL